MASTASTSLDHRARELLLEQQRRIYVATDHMLMWLMLGQWIGCVVIAFTVTPFTWIAETPHLHVHVMAAVGLGAVVAAAPIYLAIRMPGDWLTRQVMALSQILFSILLIHISGGRVEAHFHVFGSLAFLACYRDWRVLLTATLLVAADHIVRGVWWPQSVFGTELASSLRWIEHAVWVLFEDSVLLVAMARSLTEMKQLCHHQASLEQAYEATEQEVRDRTRELGEAKEFLRGVLDSLDANICILDHHGTIIDINRNWRSYPARVGAADGQATPGTNYLQVCRKATGACRDVALQTAEGIESVIRGERDCFTMDYPCDTPTDKAWYQIRVTPLNGEDGLESEANSVVVSHIDVTDQVADSLALEDKTREAEKLALVAKYTDNAVIITDELGYIEWVNEGFTRITGYELDEVVGRVPGHILQGPDSDPDVVREIRDALTRREGFDCEIVNYHKSGEPYWVAIEVRPIYDAQGNVTKFMGLETDISQKVAATAERERLQKELLDSSHRAGMAELATDILHNVGNVLNSINVSAKLINERLQSNSAETLQRTADLLAEHRSDLAHFVTEDKRGKLLPDFIAKLAERAASEQHAVADELSSLTKNVEHVKAIVAFQQGYAKSSAIAEHLQLADLCDDAIQAVDASLENHRISLRKEYAKCPDVETEKHKVLQVLVNMISNAKHAVLLDDKATREITVRVYPTDASTIIAEVEDNGIGIDQAIEHRIFEHGFTTKKNGHGFGLHGSANAARAVGGQIHVHSDGPGLGATFRLELPMSETRSNECTTKQKQMAGS